MPEYGSYLNGIMDSPCAFSTAIADEQLENTYNSNEANNNLHNLIHAYYKHKLTMFYYIKLSYFALSVPKTKYVS